MSSINKMKREIEIDIEIIEDALASNDYTCERNAHMKIDSKYSSKIKNWGFSQYGWREDMGFIYDRLSSNSIEHNLINMKSKLEGYLQDVDLIFLRTQSNNQEGVIINNNNTNINSNVNNNFDFKLIEKKISENESMTDIETQEALKKLKELESIYKSNESRKQKWEKSKKILKWLADKSVDVAISYFPIIVSMFQK